MAFGNLLFFFAAAGTDIAPLIGYSTSFYAMQGVDRINNRNTSKNFWLHVAFQASAAQFDPFLCAAKSVATFIFVCLRGPRGTRVAVAW